MLTDPDDCNQLTHDIIGGVIEVHRRFGPGLLESTYSTCLRIELEARGHTVSVRVPVALEYRGVRIDAAYWIDMLVDDRVILELKAVEALAPVHTAQLLTYLRFTGCKVGLLINFNVPVVKDGIRRKISPAI